MKRSVLIISLIFSFLTACNKETKKEKKEIGDDEIISLPITVVGGFGPFVSSATCLVQEPSPDDPMKAKWAKCNLKVDGIPKNWKEVVESRAWMNGRQFAYQNFHAGNIDKQMYADLQKSWAWTPDDKKLSRKPIKCYIYVVRGVDETGKTAVMIDTNNNLDFSDEKPFYPEKVSEKDWIKSYDKTHIANYEEYRDGQIVTTQVALLIKYVHDAQPYQYWYCIPQHAVVTLKVNGKEHQIALQRGFTSTDYDQSEIVYLDKSKPEKKYSYGQAVRQGEFLSISSGGKMLKYKNLGVDLYTNTLKLQGVPADKEEYSLQIGYPLKPFSAKEFNTGKEITLADYKGKYLFIDFWGTWCGGCVMELPQLRKLYKDMDKDKVAFLGIAGEDSKETLSRFLKKQWLPWPQILSDDTNKLIQMYNITGYASNLIISPDGKVVSRNIHGEELKLKLDELTAAK